MSNLPRYVGSAGAYKPYAVEVSPGVWKPAFKCCCHECCKIGDCCYSNESHISITSKPTITADGGSSQLTQDVVAAYNSDDISTIPFDTVFGFYCQFAKIGTEFVSDGTSYRLIYVVALAGANSGNFEIYIQQYEMGEWVTEVTWVVASLNGSTSTGGCCSFTFADSDFLSDDTITISGSDLEGVVVNNKCCHDSETGNCNKTSTDNCPEGYDCSGPP